MNYDGIDFSRLTMATAAGIRPAAEALRDIAQACGGFRVYVTNNIASGQPMIDDTGEALSIGVFGWPRNFGTWVESWWPELGYRSPVTAACRYENQPFWASASGGRTRSDPTFLAGLDFSEFEQIHFTKAAIVTPVHLRFSRVALATFTCPRNSRHDLSEEYGKYAMPLALAAKVFVEEYERLRLEKLQIPEGCLLTKREIQCLRWSAMGKTDREIADILQRTHSTVRYHLQSSANKLRAVSKPQAVYKATQLGYLSIA